MTHCTYVNMYMYNMYKYNVYVTLYLQYRNSVLYMYMYTSNVHVCTSTTNIFLCHFMTADEINNVSMTAHCCKYNGSLHLLEKESKNMSRIM